MKFNRPGDVEDDPELDELAKRTPAALYKYSGVSGQRLEWMRKLLVDGDLYFPSPSSFNDPLDCRVPPSFAEASALAIEAHWRRAVSLGVVQLAKGQTRKRAIRQMVLASRSGDARLTEKFFAALDANGTVCLTTEPADMLMWSYYADGHTGIAVRFNLSAQNLDAVTREIGRWLPIEVKYLADFPEMNYYRDKTTSLILTALGTKALAWAHEKEWRFVRVRGVGNVRMPLPMVDGVIFGMRTDPKIEADIRDSLGRNHRNVELLRVVHEPKSFRLKIVPA